jgi:hypothetical protein
MRSSNSLGGLLLAKVFAGAPMEVAGVTVRLHRHPHLHIPSLAQITVREEFPAATPGGRFLRVRAIRRKLSRPYEEVDGSTPSRNLTRPLS